MINQAHFKPAVTLISQLRTGKIKSEALLDHYLDRVERFNPTLNAIVWQDAQAARAAARAADASLAAGHKPGPLHGLPMTVKEAFDMAGAPTTVGIPGLKDNIASKDSVVVERLRAAGAVIFGKTNLPINMADWQSFNALHGTTNNPWDVSKVPGGSSGGSAAALAAGLTGAEVGSDIGSSIRNPAHYCGLFGLKPSFNAIAHRGHGMPDYLVTTDIAVLGPLARSARDLDLLLDVMAGPDPQDAALWQLSLPRCTKKSLADFRVAVKLGDDNVDVDDAYVACLQAFAEKVAAAGATVSFTAAPQVDTRRVHDVYLGLLRAATSHGIDPALIEHWRGQQQTPEGQRNPRFLKAMVEGNSMLHRDWLALDNERRHLRAKYAEFFSQWDILLCPAAASAAWPHNHDGERWQRTIEVNGTQVPGTDQLFWSGYSGVVYLPSTVGPCGFVPARPRKLPVGYQAIAGFGQDKTATAFSRAAEREIMKFKAPGGFR